MVTETKILLNGLIFPEDPRWHDGKLWFSDMGRKTVMTVDLDGNTENIVEVPGIPSGLGWKHDGALMIVSMHDRSLMRFSPGGLQRIADLSSLASYHCNDMVVDFHGRAYIGNFGFDFEGKKPFAPAEIVMVTPEGDARIVADDLSFPNGMVITPDNKTLIVGETFGARVTAFDIEPDGSLSGRRVWADLPGAMPDGIALDAEGALWVPSPISGTVFRVKEGGAIIGKVQVQTQPYACRLGGPNRQMLFICTSAPIEALFNVASKSFNGQESIAGSAGRIEMIAVDIPGAGFP